MGFINWLFGTGTEKEHADKPKSVSQDMKAELIVTTKDDSLSTHLDKIQGFQGLSAHISYRGLLIYAIQAFNYTSFLMNPREMMQKAALIASTGDLSGTVLELKGKDGSGLPHETLLKTLGIVSYEAKQRDGELAIITPVPPGPDIVIACVVRENPTLKPGYVNTDPTMVKLLQRALGIEQKRAPATTSETMDKKISEICRPDTPILRVPSIVGLITVTLKREGLPETEITGTITRQLMGICPSCRRYYSGDEIMYFCNMKNLHQDGMKFLKEASPDVKIVRMGGAETHRTFHRFNLGNCLNSSCDSKSIDLSWK